LNRKTIISAIVLIAVIAVSLFVTLNWWNPPAKETEFYVGVEVAYTNANVSDVREMVDKVKNYTNLFVIGSVELTYNETALDESCDYIYNAGLKIVVLFTNVSNYSFDPRGWLTQARQKYGDGLLGLYRYDEPGGDQLENEKLRFVKNATDYADAASNFTETLRGIVDYYVSSADRIFTADYGLYWWDYKTNYTAVFAEFVGNQSRQRNIALCRGAANAHDKDFGAIITWKYDNPPYIESRQELYDDLTLAYTAGARYLIVFDYPKLDSYGILKEEHFDALQRFWNYAHDNPQAFGSTKAEVAYVLPADYGFGFRSATDNIWGLFPSDDLAAKAWSEVNKLISQYGAGFDALFDDEDFANASTRYDKIIFWNETVS
jgi:hypothetical protein